MIRAFLLALFLLPAFAHADGTFSVGYPQTAYVYGTASGVLRRIIVPAPGEISTQSYVTGETPVVQDAGMPTDEASIRASIAAAIGKTPAKDRCAVVNSGNVVDGNLRCDPVLDSLPGKTLIQDDLAQPGDKRAGAIFTRSFAIVNPATSKVVQIIDLNIHNPVSPTMGHQLFPAGDLKVGDTVIIKPRPK